MSPTPTPRMLAVWWPSATSSGSRRRPPLRTASAISPRSGSTAKPRDLGLAEVDVRLVQEGGAGQSVVVAHPSARTRSWSSMSGDDDQVHPQCGGSSTRVRRLWVTTPTPTIPSTPTAAPARRNGPVRPAGRVPAPGRGGSRRGDRADPSRRPRPANGMAVSSAARRPPPRPPLTTPRRPRVSSTASPHDHHPSTRIPCSASTSRASPMGKRGETSTDPSSGQHGPDPRPPWPPESPRPGPGADASPRATAGPSSSVRRRLDLPGHRLGDRRGARPRRRPG